VSGQNAELPVAAPETIASMGGVTQLEYTGLTSASVYRSPLIPGNQTNALGVRATSLGLPATLGTSLARGSYLNAATCAVNRGRIISFRAAHPTSRGLHWAYK